MPSIIDDMVTYCLGSARQKREYFSKMDGAVVLDNVEVLFCASENGRNYFAYGDVPFAAFTVAEYLKSRRALCKTAPPAGLLGRLRLRESKRLGKLAPAEMRCVTFVEKTCGNADKPVVINLDGAKYTRRNAAALRRLIALCKDVYVCVTDVRFVRRLGAHAQTLAFGKPAKRTRAHFYAAKRLAQQINAKRVSVM